MKNLVAKDIMNPEVYSVTSDMTVHELAHFFTERMISGAPVIEPDGKLLGVVTISDIIRNDEHRSDILDSDDSERYYYLNGWEDGFNREELEGVHIEESDELTVKDIMTPLIFKVPETEPIASMADTMIGGRIHRLFITRENKVVGIVTTLDMLKAIKEYAK